MFKKLFLFICMFFVLTGCSNKNLKYEIKTRNELKNNIHYKKNVEIDVNRGNENIIDSHESVNVDINSDNGNISFNPRINYDLDVKDKSVVDNSNFDVVINIPSGEKVLNFFSDGYNKVKSYLSDKTISDAKVKCREVFITFVDFIFYDTEIEGITFKELTSDIKEKIISIVKNTDELINSKYPNYKDMLSNKTRELFSNLKNNVQSFVEENVSSSIIQKYNEVSEDALNRYENTKEIITSKVEENPGMIDNFKNKYNETFEKAKSKLSNWYQNFKNKN